MFQHKTPINRLLNMKMLAGSKAIEATATGNPLTFLTDLARPLKSLLIPFTPQQEGTGDPSPTNVRNIAPWNEVTVCGAGGNLINASELQDGYVWWNGSKIGGYNANCVTPLIPVKENATYYRQGATSSQNAISFFDKDKAFLSQTVAQPPVSFTIPDGACYMGLTFGKDHKDEAMVNVGSSALLYEEYKPITETDISFPSPVYGGTLDAVTGVLTVEWVGKSATWGALERSAPQQETQYIRAMLPFDDAILIAGQGGLPKNSFCNVGKYTWETSVLGEPHFYPARVEGKYYAFVFLHKDTPDETIVQAVCKLAEPQTVQLTPSQITALVGNNTLWSDADGSMTAVFLKKG